MTQITDVEHKIAFIQDLSWVHLALFVLFRDDLNCMLTAIGSMADRRHEAHIISPVKSASKTRAKMRSLTELGFFWNLQAIKEYFITRGAPNDFNSDPGVRPWFKDFAEPYITFEHHGIKKDL